MFLNIQASRNDFTVASQRKYPCVAKEYCFLIALSMLAGCSVGPKYRLPDVRVPPFHNAPRAGTEKSAAPPLDTWWEGFPPAYGLSTSAIASIPVARA